MIIKVPIHSFVDLITNSSSETFISATDKTVEAVYEIIDGLFNQAAYPNLSSRDFFEVKVDGQGSSSVSNIEVVAKNPNDPRSKAVAEAFGKLFDSIEGYSEYNG